jgi:hypothetical protein
LQELDERKQEEDPVIYSGTSTSSGAGAITIEVIVPSGELATEARSTLPLRSVEVTRENNRVFKAVGMAASMPCPLPFTGGRGGLWKFVGTTANSSQVTINLYTNTNDTDC